MVQKLVRIELGEVPIEYVREVLTLLIDALIDVCHFKSREHADHARKLLTTLITCGRLYTEQRDHDVLSDKRFAAILNRLAESRRGSSGRGRVWVLKPQYEILRKLAEIAEIQPTR